MPNPTIGSPHLASAELLNVHFGGSLVRDTAYTGTAGECVRGVLRRVDGAEAQIPGRGVVLAGGRQGLRFDRSPTALGGRPGLEPAGVVVEVLFTPTGSQADPAYLLAGSRFAVVHLDGELVYGITGEGAAGLAAHARVPAPAPRVEHGLAVWLLDQEDGLATLDVMLDGVRLASLTAPATSPSGDPAETVVFGNALLAPGVAGAGFVGSIAAVRVAVAGGSEEPRSQLRPTIGAAVRSGAAPGTGPADAALTPGNYQDVTPDDPDALILAKAVLVRPTRRQAAWQREQLTAFIHFGVNTFLAQEWGHGTEDPAVFDPTEDIDPDAWVRQLRDAGCRTAILTLKHHDGFMLWPTRYSAHSVAASPWRKGRGDVAAEFTAAARRHGMKVGFYLSPADSHAEIRGIYGNGSARSPRTIPTLVPGDDRAGLGLDTYVYQATDYGEFFLNTLYEVLTQYGEICEVWFDGAVGNTARSETFDYDAYYDLIGRLQPGANVAVGGRDIRWVGNEVGVARRDEWSVVGIADPGDGKIEEIQPGGPFSEDLGSDEQLIAAVRSGAANRLHWWPAEADMRLTPGWFAHPGDVPKTGAELLRHFEETVGRNCVMLLNVPPTVTGRFAPASVAALEEFAAERRKAFGLDHAVGVPAAVGDGIVDAITNGEAAGGHAFAAGDRTPIVLDLGAERAVGRVGVSEDILAAGMTVKAFTVEAELDGAWRQVAAAGVVGALRIVRFPAPVVARRWRFTVTDARGPYAIAAIHLWEHLDNDPLSSGPDRAS